MESNPFRVIPLLALAHPVEGIILFQVQGAHEEMVHLRGRFRRKSGYGFGSSLYTCIRIV